MSAKTTYSESRRRGFFTASVYGDESATLLDEVLGDFPEDMAKRIGQAPPRYDDDVPALNYREQVICRNMVYFTTSHRKRKLSLDKHKKVFTQLLSSQLDNRCGGLESRHDDSWRDGKRKDTANTDDAVGAWPQGE